MLERTRVLRGLSLDVAVSKICRRFMEVGRFQLASRRIQNRAAVYHVGAEHRCRWYQELNFGRDKSEMPVSLPYIGI